LPILGFMQIRITTKDSYGVGTLWIIDAVHLPYGCSVRFHTYIDHDTSLNHFAHPIPFILRSGPPSGHSALTSHGPMAAKSTSSRVST
jgi:hypothetical protein